MDVIGHEEIGPDLRSGAFCRLGEEIEVECVVGIFEERLLTTVATLGDLMRDVGMTARGRRAMGPRLAEFSKVLP